MKIVPTLPAEPLINHNVPQGPWQKISVDFMKWDNKSYLLIKDYFSKISFLFLRSCTTVSAVINHLTELSALKNNLHSVGTTASVTGLSVFVVFIWTTVSFIIVNFKFILSLASVILPGILDSVCFVFDHGYGVGLCCSCGFLGPAVVCPKSLVYFRFV